MIEILKANLLSPIPLAFALGLLAKLIRSEFSLPKEIYVGLSVYLLFALGLKGGVELSHAPAGTVAGPIAVTLLLGIITPVTSYLVLRRLGRFSIADAAGIAAHYGSVSAVTYIAAQTFIREMGHEVEGYLPTLLTLLESPGIHVALAIGALQTAGSGRAVSAVMHEVLTGRTMVLLVGGLLVGFVMGEESWKTIELFYDPRGPVFRGALTLFILEMGVVAGARVGDLRRVGPFLFGFAVLVPVLHGALGAWLGLLAGLSVGGATVLGTMAASASYIAAPPAVRVMLPEANPTYSITAALAITFPFNLLLGIPLYYAVAQRLHG